MSILRRVGTTQEEREAYLKCPPWREREDVECTLPAERVAELAENEQFILTVTENGYGKRSSAYEYRRTNRGGQGITNIDTSERNGGVVASFPVTPGEQLMLVTDQAKMIRTTVGDIRVMGRNTQGVTIFRVAEDEHVVSVAKIEETEEEEIESKAATRLRPMTARSSAKASSTSRPIRSRNKFLLRLVKPTNRCNRGLRSFILDNKGENTPCPFPTTRWCWSPTAARCCFSAITGTKIRSIFAPRLTTRGQERKDREIKTDAPGTVKQSVGYGRSTYEETDFQQQEEDRWVKDAADELKSRVLRNDLRHWQLSPRQRPSASSRSACTRKSRDASSAPSTRK